MSVVTRRYILKSLSAALLTSAAVTGISSRALAADASNEALKPPPMKLGNPVPFDPNMVEEKAKKLAAKPYKARASVPKPWLDLNYDEYRGISFEEQSALWRNTDSPFQTHFFAPGLYFPKPVQINVVEADQTRSVHFSLDNFQLRSIVPKLPVTKSLGFSGFRLHGNIQEDGRYNEFAVFQGASYFRAIGKGDIYGLSARGLALKTGDPDGEEFPDFIEFWMEEATPGQENVIVHALLDSPSVSGAYRFDIKPGPNTIMDVSAVLFPRTALTHVGLAPQTSMFLFDETNRNRFDDFRPAVHDNDGLMVKNGAGEQLWRPLANPKSLQVSNFLDNNPKGFGLMQRASTQEEFADFEALYHKRPGMWIEPGEGWGRGSVTLVEIPTDREIYDNIVTYWRPREPLPAGTEHRMSYRLTWGKNPVDDDNVSRVLNTRSGERHGGGRVVAIDFAPHDKIPTNLDDLNIFVGVSAGKASKPIVQRNPATGGIRVNFTFYPGKNKAVEMRCQLRADKKTVSEVWLYRWTA